MKLRLRHWQAEALQKAHKWLLEEGHRNFLLNTAPASGKTLAACAITKMMFDKKKINRVIVIAPRTEVVNQWSENFRQVTGRFMGKVTGRDGDISSLEMDICATWAAVQGLQPELQAVCRTSDTLVICDEHHHAAVQAVWGTATDSAFADAKFCLILTGTPIRSDGAEPVWLAYDGFGAIDHPEGGTYTLSYGEAVDLGYCRPVTFHRHEGNFTVDLGGATTLSVSGNKPAELPEKFARIPGLQRSLNFYTLARTPQFEADRKTPKLTGYQATMVQSCGEKLTELRLRMPNAGGLVIADKIEMADYIANLIERIEGKRPVLVHSNTPNVEGKIKGFRNTDNRWIVSVGMISEGVDIKRLRVLLYLPNALTELAFRQAIGRVVRTFGHEDDTRAYVVMPSFEIFDTFARRVEAEMSPAKRAAGTPPRKKCCPVCTSECELGATICLCCGHEFPTMPPQLKTCDECGSLNPLRSTQCQVCGVAFGLDFILTLDEALRTGAIVRGMDINEPDVLVGEAIAPKVRSRMLSSGDETLVRIVKVLPEESWGRLSKIFADALPKHN